MRTNKPLNVLFLLGVIAIAVLLTAGPLAAQEKFGALTGVAYDESGGVLPGVAVTVTNKDTARVITLVTAGDGAYFARSLDPGRYSVKFELRGFTPTEFPDINVLVGQTFKLDSKLKVGGVEAQVEVTDTAPLIDTLSTLVATNITAEEFTRLPKTRSFQYFAVTAPAVNTGDIEGGIQVNGASGAENAFNIDGITTNSLIDGRSRQNATFEYLQEVQVKTAGIEAEYGGALGGVITAVTKTGGNAFHGEVHYYYSGNRLSAAPVRRLVLDPRDDRTVNYYQDADNPDHNQELGFSLGGPIKKDMLYFFTSASPRWRKQDQTYNFSLGTQPGMIERDQTYMSVFNKVSFDPSSRIRSNFGWLYSPSKSKGTLPGYNGAGANWLSSSAASNEPNKVRGFFSPQSSYTGNVDWILSNTVLLSGRGGYFWDNYKDTGIPNISSVTYQTTAVGLSFVPTSLQGPVGTQNVPRARHNKHDLTSRAYGQVDVNVSGDAWGFHNFKAGYGLQKTVNNVDISYPGGGYVYVFWDRSFRSLATGITDRGPYGYYEVHDFGTVGSTGAGIKSFYAQDQWRIRNRLTLNLGLRIEEERIPSFRREIKSYAFDFSWGDKIAPRLGASFDVLGNGKMKAYGSWGRFYDWTKYELARGTFGGDIWRVRYRSLDTLDVFSLSGTNMPGRDIWNAAVTDSFRDRRVPSFGSTTIDPDIKPMSQDSITAGVDYQLNPQTVVGVRYVHNDLRRTIEDLGVLVDGDEHYIYANPGEGIAKILTGTTGLTAPFPYPKPVRDYDAVEFTISKRFSSRWFGMANYTWSRLWGNYAGLASSDEVRTPTTGVSSSTTQQQAGSISRAGSNANRAWDLDELLFDSHGNYDPRGRLATDRPHVFKFNGGYEFRWGSEVSGFFYAGSGTPLTTNVVTTNQIPVFVNGRGDLGRTDILSYTDLLVAHTFKFDETRKLRVEFNMLNAFNQKTSRHRFDYLNRGAGVSRQSSAIDLSGVDLQKGYDYNALILKTTDGTNALDPRFGMDDLFSTGFAGRLGVKFTF